MARHVERRDDLDPARVRSFQDFDVVGSRKIAVDRRVAGRPGPELRKQAARFAGVEATIGANRSEFGQPRYLEPPAFVVAKVEVELVELVPAHLLDDLEYLRLAVEIAGEIDVQAAKSE